jgi:hypothetical protein
MTKPEIPGCYECNPQQYPTMIKPFAPCPNCSTPNPNDMSAAAEDAAIMYRGDCYKGNHTNPHVRESYADQGYEGFLAGVAWAKSQAASEVADRVDTLKNALDTAWRLIMAMDGTSPGVDVSLARQSAEFWERKERHSRITPSERSDK